MDSSLSRLLWGQTPTVTETTLFRGYFLLFVDQFTGSVSASKMNFMLRKWPTMWRSLKEPVTVWPIHYSIFSFNRALSQKLLCGCTVLNWFKWPPCQGERSGCLYRPVFLLMSWHCKSPHYFICHTSLVSERGISRHNAFFLSCINRERETKKKKTHSRQEHFTNLSSFAIFFGSRLWKKLWTRGLYMTCDGDTASRRWLLSVLLVPRLPENI